MTTNSQKQTILTTSDVAINTVSIEVKVMKIGNRQVTLSVFRQLPDEDIINEKTGELLGIPWGRVNYCPDCAKDTLPHFHIVWQKGNELRRASIEKRWTYGPPRDLRDELLYDDENPVQLLNYYVEAYLCARAMQGWYQDDFGKKNYMMVPIKDRQYELLVEGIDTNLRELWKVLRVMKERKDRLDKWLEALREDPDNEHRLTMLNEAQKLYDAAVQQRREYGEAVKIWLEEQELTLDPESLYQNHLKHAWNAYDRYMENWRATYAQLEALDQLFIAV